MLFLKTHQNKCFHEVNVCFCAAPTNSTHTIMLFMYGEHFLRGLKEANIQNQYLIHLYLFHKNIDHTCSQHK